MTPGCQGETSGSMRRYGWFWGALRAALGLALGLVVGCRGEPSTAPPIRVIQDMWYQPSRRPQMTTELGTANIPIRLVEGVVIEGAHLMDEAESLGLSGGVAVPRLPVPLTRELVEGGEELYAAYCAPCHDRTGSGQGTVASRGFPAPVDLASENTRGLRDGELFRIMADGVRNMPPMNGYVDSGERWALVAWVRVLQRSRAAAVADVEPGLVARILPEESQP